MTNDTTRLSTVPRRQVGVVARTSRSFLWARMRESKSGSLNRCKPRFPSSSSLVWLNFRLQRCFWIFPQVVEEVRAETVPRCQARSGPNLLCFASTLAWTMLRCLLVFAAPLFSFFCTRRAARTSWQVRSARRILRSRCLRGCASLLSCLSFCNLSPAESSHCLSLDLRAFLSILARPSKTTRRASVSLSLRSGQRVGDERLLDPAQRWPHPGLLPLRPASGEAQLDIIALGSPARVFCQGGPGLCFLRR
jgi:hypothetical protein